MSWVDEYAQRAKEIENEEKNQKQGMQQAQRELSKQSKAKAETERIAIIKPVIKNHEKEGIALVFEVLSAIIFFGGFVAGIIMDKYGEFDWLEIVLIWGLFSAYGLILYAFSEILKIPQLLKIQQEQEYSVIFENTNNLIVPKNRNVQKTLSPSQSVAEENNSTESRPAYLASVADEILKYKKLCDEGIITEGDFQVKVRQLLGI